MSDETKSGDQPTPNAGADLDALVQSLTAEFDKRFQGFQGILDRRDAEYRQMLEDLKTADLSPEEQEQARLARLQAEKNELERKVEILSMRKDYPEEVDLLSSLLEGRSLQDQLTLLSAFRKTQPSSDEPSAEGQDEGVKSTPVDRNNPARKSQPSLADAGANMTKELADQILSESGDQPGLLQRLRLR